MNADEMRSELNRIREKIVKIVRDPEWYPELEYSRLLRERDSLERQIQVETDHDKKSRLCLAWQITQMRIREKEMNL